MYDELELDTLGDEKTALFLMMSDTDGSFNFLISMIYTQLFNLLCEKADDVYTMVVGEDAQISTIKAADIKEGDVISLKENSKKSEKFKQIIEANASKAAPTWLDVNKDNQTAKVLRMPVKEDLDYDIEEHLIVELYNK